MVGFEVRYLLEGLLQLVMDEYKNEGCNNVLHGDDYRLCYCEL